MKSTRRPIASPASRASGEQGSCADTRTTTARRLSLLLVHRERPLLSSESESSRLALTAEGSSTVSLASRDSLILGSDESCDVRFDGGNVCRRHCEIYRLGDLVWVRDLGSESGTYLDGELVEAAPLPHRAVLQLGSGGPEVEIESGSPSEVDWDGRTVEGDGRGASRGGLFSRLHARLTCAAGLCQAWPSLLVLGVALVLGALASAASGEGGGDFDLSTAFSYQGRLEQKGRPAEGRFDLAFELYDDTEGGRFLGRIDRFDHPVSAGAFATELDFGVDVFSTRETWLEIQVRPSGEGAYTTLSPRQRVSSGVASTCVVDSDVEINGDLNLGLGHELLIGNAITGLRLDRNQIEVSALADSELLINPSGGSRQVGVGLAHAEAPLNVTGSPDASPQGGGAVVVGSTAGANIAIDNNEIMARKAGAPSTLYLNYDGGYVAVGGATGPHVAIDGNEIQARNNGAPSTLYLNYAGGAVSLGGPLDIGLEIVQVNNYSNDRETATCPAGKRVIGGGCSASDDIRTSRPKENGDGWQCILDSSAVVYVFAICANVQ